jgi:hypothetical protein
MSHLACTKEPRVFLWGSDLMATIPPVVKDAVQVAKTAQILSYMKENQLLTALCLFVLWQTGAIVTAMSTAQGAVC